MASKKLMQGSGIVVGGNYFRNKIYGHGEESKHDPIFTKKKKVRKKRKKNR